MATFNGGFYLKEQLDSIIKQLQKDDEIIIVDDCSTDNTIDVIKSIDDRRIRIYKNDVNMGHVFSFGRAIKLASKELIFLSDQDDIWVENRVSIMESELIESESLCISTKFIFIDQNGKDLNMQPSGVLHNQSTKYFKNLVDIMIGCENYFGCAMAFRQELKNVILPIPSFVESHDLWIAKSSNLLKSNLHCNHITLKRRLHGNNASVISRSFFKKIKSRILFIKSIFYLLYRIHLK
jgi:glycosyltransferase involved in cell wall biosynthesis